MEQRTLRAMISLDVGSLVFLNSNTTKQKKLGLFTNFLTPKV